MGEREREAAVIFVYALVAAALLYMSPCAGQIG